VLGIIMCDEREESALLAYVLQEAGLMQRQFDDLDTALSSFKAKPADLVVLALRGLPLVDQVRRVRQETTVYVAAITERATEDRVCKAYDLGADLVVQRPFSARLLLQQLRALVRRSQGTVLSILPSMRVGPVVLDPGTRTVQVGDRPIRRLTQLEFRLLYTMMLHRGQIVPVETIVERVWGYEGTGNTQLVRGLVRRLRAKVEEDPRHPVWIQSAPGIGYRFSG